MHQIVDLIINRVVNNCLSLIIVILLRTKALSVLSVLHHRKQCRTWGVCCCCCCFKFYSRRFKHLVNIYILSISPLEFWIYHSLQMNQPQAEKLRSVVGHMYCWYLITSKSRHQFTSRVLIAFESSMHRTIAEVTLQNRSRKYRFFLILMN